MDNLMSFVQNHLDPAWNSHDIERVLECFDEHATITFSPPVPGIQSSARGKEEIRTLAETLLPGFHVDSKNIKVEGNQVKWYARLTSDVFRNLGVDVVECNATATIRNNKVQTLTPSITDDSITKLRASAQQMGKQPPQEQYPRAGKTRQ